MTNRVLGALASALSVGSMLALAVPAAHAQSDNAAIVIKQDGCNGSVPTAAGQIFPPFSPIWFDADATRHVVRTKNGWSLHCVMDIPAALVPDEVRRAEGFLCGNFTVGFTRDTIMQATPGGKLRVSCQVNGQNTASPVPF